MSTSSRRIRPLTPRARGSSARRRMLLCAALPRAPRRAPVPRSDRRAEHGRSPPPEDGYIDAGTYVVTGFTVPFEVTVPDGWRVMDGWRLKRDRPDGRGVFLTFLNPAYVPADGCAWSTSSEVEPSVEGFVDALVAAASTTTTVPTEVMVGDYRALEFDFAVESDIDIETAAPLTCASTRRHRLAHGIPRPCCSTRLPRVDLHGERAVLSVGQRRRCRPRPGGGGARSLRLDRVQTRRVNDVRPRMGRRIGVPTDPPPAGPR